MGFVCLVNFFTWFLEFDLGLLFLYFCRRDSFITHRAFCDALTKEAAGSLSPAAAENPNLESDPHVQPSGSSSPPPSAPPLSAATGAAPIAPPPSTDAMSSIASIENKGKYS